MRGSGRRWSGERGAALGNVRSRSAGPTSSSPNRLASSGPLKWRRRSAALNVTVLAPESCAAANALPSRSAVLTCLLDDDHDLLAAGRAHGGVAYSGRAPRHSSSALRSRRRRRVPPRPGRAPPGSSPRPRRGGAAPPVRARAGAPAAASPCAARAQSSEPLHGAAKARWSSSARRPRASGARSRGASGSPARWSPEATATQRNPRRHESWPAGSWSRSPAESAPRAQLRATIGVLRRPASSRTPTRARTHLNQRRRARRPFADALCDSAFVMPRPLDPPGRRVELRPLRRIGMPRAAVHPLERGTGFAEAASLDRRVHLAFGDVAQAAVRLPALRRG